jgi:subtilisin family serine protease
VVAVLAVPLAAIAAVTPIASATPTALPSLTPAAAAPPVLPPGHTYTVTLLTGDVVTVRTLPSGCPLVSVRPAGPGEVITKGCDSRGHVRVVPAGTGTAFDPALFDVTTLIQQGYDDAHSADLPVIVQYADDNARDPYAAGLTRTRGLPSIHGLAGRQPKAHAARLAQGLPWQGRTSAVRRIWLDRRLRATREETPAGAGLDRNLTQVGAPAAWSAGYTGRGVRVAVLDTGVDATHPDLAGTIAETKDFTGSTDVVDRFGHGTHVAAIIAGSGAASGGHRRGVAPGAQLVIGKVLGDDGSGSESQVIDGMQWAAARASVVNMSLGGFEPSDGTDPISQALDGLTARYGALFVVAAGNNGPDSGTISAPAAAASALTVGAVDGTDTLATFSSRGPLVNTRAAKPEIVAPGVDIVAARAAGTSIGTPIDARYTRLSGTSMATPHVAGAAAIVAQRHPGWTAGQLKAALVGAADPIGGADLYGQGGGRLDIPRALGSPVPDQAIINLGTFAFPQSGTSETALSWTNPGDAAATLVLSVTLTRRDGLVAPPGAVSLSAGVLTLAPGRSGTVAMRVDPTRLASRPGLYQGVVTAWAGQVAVRTPVAAFVEPPSYDLTVRATALPGTPPGAMAGSVLVVDLDDPALYQVFAGFSDSGDGTGLATLRVPAGRYSVTGDVQDTTSGAIRDGLAGDADVTVAGPTTVTFDGAAAKPVTATVAGTDTTTTQVGLAYVQTGRRGSSWFFETYSTGDRVDGTPIWAAPVRGARVGSFHQYEFFTLTAAGPSLYDLQRGLPTGGAADPAYRVDGAERDRLVRIDQRFNHLDAPDTVTGHQRYGLTPEGALISQEGTTSAPASRVDYVSPDVWWLDEAFYTGVLSFMGRPFPVVTEEMPRRYPAGSRQRKEWVRQPLRPDWFDDPALAVSFCTPESTSRTSGNLHVALIGITDEHQRFGCLDGDPAWEAGIARTLTLSRDGQQIGAVAGVSRADFAVPRSTGVYRLTYDLDASRLLAVCTRTTTTWTFRSTGPSGTGSVAVPLLSVDYALPLDATNHPDGALATFTVRQAVGVPAEPVTAMAVWTSVDDGRMWTVAPVQRAGDGRFAVRLPVVPAGQFVSLRVVAATAGGSEIDQKIIRVYRAAPPEPSGGAAG